MCIRVSLSPPPLGGVPPEEKENYRLGGSPVRQLPSGGQGTALGFSRGDSTDGRHGDW